MPAIHSYLSAVLAVIVGTVMAFIYTSYVNHRTNQNDIIKDYLADLQKIEDLCRMYWLPLNGDLPLQHSNIGHELRAKLEATSVYYTLSQNILGHSFAQFKELDQKLFDLATGGDFQTKRFEPCVETYAGCIEAISEIRNLLRTKRNTMFWSR